MAIAMTEVDVVRGTSFEWRTYFVLSTVFVLPSPLTLDLTTVRLSGSQGHPMANDSHVLGMVPIAGPAVFTKCQGIVTQVFNWWYIQLSPSFCRHKSDCCWNLCMKSPHCDLGFIASSDTIKKIPVTNHSKMQDAPNHPSKSNQVCCSKCLQNERLEPFCDISYDSDGRHFCTTKLAKRCNLMKTSVCITMTS